MKKIIPVFLLVILFAIAAFAQSATVIAENANLRGTASATGRIVSTLSYGTDVEVLRQSGPWFLVQAPGDVGWIHGNTIKYTEKARIETATDSQNSPWRPIVTRSVETPAPSQPAARQPVISTPAPAPAPTVDPDTVGTTATAICRDGTVSYSQNRSGTCSHHGGVSSWINDPAPSYTPSYSTPSSGGTVQVRGYYRKDGTYVRPHTRSAPRRRN